MIDFVRLKFDDEFMQSITNENITDETRELLQNCQEYFPELIEAMTNYAFNISNKHPSDVIAEQFSEALKALGCTKLIAQDEPIPQANIAEAVHGFLSGLLSRKNIKKILKPRQLALLDKHLDFYYDLLAKDALLRPEFDQIIAAGKSEQEGIPLTPHVAVVKMQQKFEELMPHLVDTQREFLQSLDARQAER